MDSNTTKFVTCLEWVKRGVAKSVPNKVCIDQDDLREAILNAKMNGEDDTEEVDTGETPARDTGNSNTQIDIVAKYDMDNYDEDEDKQSKPSHYAQFPELTCHADSHDDPYITVPDDDDSDSDREDFEIKPQDNLILTGFVEGDCSCVQVYVYNSEQGNLFVHHEMMLPTLPLALEWLDFNPSEEDPGNFVAIGTTDPVIEVWDVDTVDSLEPAFKLGKKAKKKKKKPGVGHKDAVLGLSWNRNARHVLASGSADNTVILWDMSTSAPSTTLTSHEDKVQCLKWHPREQESLLTGSCDGHARVFDCRHVDVCKKFDMEGEVERVVWNTFDPFHFLASSDTGMVKYFDVRGQEPIWTLSAHYKPCTGLSLSSCRAGMLLTGSFDKTMKLWDFSGGSPQMVMEKNWDLGQILAAEFSPDSPHVICLGGDNRSDCFKVWDIRNSKKARHRFATEEGSAYSEEDMSES